MDYETAVISCKAGKAIRHPGMSGGWIIRWSPRALEMFNINPHTGADYLFTPAADEMARQDWTEE